LDLHLVGLAAGEVPELLGSRRTGAWVECDGWLIDAVGCD
jgi:hypothetical protein